MYLSKLVLNTSDSKVRKDLGDDYEMHRTIMRGFSQTGDNAREAFSVLYRLEEQEQGVTTLVQSEMAPDWSQLPGGYVVDTAVKKIAGLEQSIHEGMQLRFQLFANPCRKVKPMKGEPGRLSKRVFLKTEQEQLQWLIRKGEQYGFCLPANRDGGLAVIVRSSKDGRSRTKELCFQRVNFSGILVVKDSSRLLDGWKKGIGPEKAFGCGMLLLSR